ncbi:hypothetical protein LINGRAHAP2_LOCUS24458 [Linum grandiflorum]
MIRSAFKLSRSATAVAKAARSGFISRKPNISCPSSAAVGTPLRLLHGELDGPNANPVALQMIDYALSLPRSQKSDESYGQAMLVLEQCLASQSSDVEDVVSENSKGMVLLAMANLSFERGNSNEALEQLQKVGELEKATLGVKVSAMEALAGLNLELGNDAASSVVADKCLELLENEKSANSSAGFEVASARAKAIKGFVELVCCNVQAAESLFEGLQGNSDCVGSATLSYGEFLHATRNFSKAKELYQKVTEGVFENKGLTDINALSACNMGLDQVQLAATCALGQLEAHMGKFDDAEETLTKALNRAELLCGPRHPKVGLVLTCLALMLRQKAIQEGSSSLLMQEKLQGLYRRAIELLKVPPVDSEGDRKMEAWRDIAALARAGYAEVLCVQENRKSEGEKMRSWAEAQWRNSRLSLAEALRTSESSDRVVVIDARTARAL